MSRRVAVHVGTPLLPGQLARVRAVSPRLDVSYLPHSPHEPPVGLDAYLPDVEVLLSYHVTFELDRAPRLRWVQVPSDGVDHLIGAPLMRSDVLVTNTRVFATPIAEYVIGSMVAFFRSLPRIYRDFQVGRAWPRNQWDVYAGEELAGKTLGILGFGDIGHRLARVAWALDMRVVATRRSATAVAWEDGVRVYPPSGLHEALAVADMVVVCLPLTSETRGLIGEAELRAMKPTAYLVAVGRGAVIQEEALVRALREGWIAGAGLDVFSQKPLPTSSPLFDLPNVILTPHMSGVSQGFYERFIELFCENLRRYMAGAPLLHLVDKERGY